MGLTPYTTTGIKVHLVEQFAETAMDAVKMDSDVELHGPATVDTDRSRKATLAGGLLAAEKTVTLSVPGMTCEACPITVRKALEKVPGVMKVKATYEPREAVFTFDDAKTGVEKLTEATKRAGYPSSLMPVR